MALFSTRMLSSGRLWSRSNFSTHAMVCHSSAFWITSRRALKGTCARRWRQLRVTEAAAASDAKQPLEKLDPRGRRIEYDDTEPDLTDMLKSTMHHVTKDTLTEAGGLHRFAAGVGGRGRQLRLHGGRGSVQCDSRGGELLTSIQTSLIHVFRELQQQAGEFALHSCVRALCG